MAGPGVARHGKEVHWLANCGSFPQRWNVMAWQGVAWLGQAGQGKGTSVHGGGFAIVMACRGTARPGEARHGMAWQG